MAYLRRRDAPWWPSAWLVNLGAGVVWLWSRCWGLPIGPEPGVPETVGAADLISTPWSSSSSPCWWWAASRAAGGTPDRLRLPVDAGAAGGGDAIGGVALATAVALLSLGGAA